MRDVILDFRHILAEIADQETSVEELMADEEVLVATATILAGIELATPPWATSSTTPHPAARLHAGGGPHLWRDHPLQRTVSLRPGRHRDRDVGARHAGAYGVSGGEARTIR
ncbi:hypothetical protein QP028_14520 [Corynebacterium suedekumii]|nr:hypothetical protein QP028_14520 [Corynebacterium suedekumii]